VANLLQGRVDVWCRCVTAAFYLSDDFRRDTLLSLVLLRGEGRRAGDEEVPAEAAGCRLVQVGGLHSSTFQLNLGRVWSLKPQQESTSQLNLRRFRR